MVAELEVVADPDAPHPARTDLDLLEHQLVGHTLRAVGRMLQRVGQDGLFDCRGHAVQVRSLRPGQPVEQAVGAVQLMGYGILARRWQPWLGSFPQPPHTSTKNRNPASSDRAFGTFPPLPPTTSRNTTRISSGLPRIPSRTDAARL